MDKKSNQPLFRYMAMRKILPTILLFLALLFFFFLAIKWMTIHNRQMRQRHQQERLVQSIMEVDQALTEVVHRQYKILNSMELSQFVYMYDDLDWYQRYKLQKFLAKELLALKNESKYVKNVWLFIPGMNKAISCHRINPPVPTWFATYDQDDNSLKIINGETVYFVNHTNQDNYLEPIAVIAVTLSQSQIRNRFMYVLRSENDEIIMKWNVKQESTLKQNYNTPYKKNTCLTVNSNHFPLQIEYVLYEDELDVIIQQLIWLCIFFIIIILLFEILVFLNWYRKIYEPLHNLLIDAFGNAEKGNFWYRISINQNSPFRPIYDRYNQMMAKTEFYVENELKQQLLISKANLKQLQAQISPHFMYNSYYILFRLIKKGDRENSLLLCEHLGNFFHYITRNAEDEKRLSEEIEHARHYSVIQKYRFREMLEVQIDSPPPELSDIYVPTLILQPLLENAFKYAYETEKSGNVMVLRVRFSICTLSSFDIIVENSGSITNETIDYIQKKLATSDDSIETTALVNIHRRLQIYYNKKSGLSFERSALGGLLVRIHIDNSREKV